MIKQIFLIFTFITIQIHSQIPCTDYSCDSSVIAEIASLYLHTYITTDSTDGRIDSVELDIWDPVYLPEAMTLVLRLSNLKNLHISSNRSSTGPPGTPPPVFPPGKFEMLSELSIKDMNLYSMPDISNLPVLKSFRLSNTYVSNLSTITDTNHTLEFLTLSSNMFTNIPGEIYLFKYLKRLDLNVNQIESIPIDFSHPSLEYLGLRFNKLKLLPQTLDGYGNLDTLDIFNNYITELPVEITQLTQTRIILRDNLICQPHNDILAWFRDNYTLHQMSQRCQSYFFQSGGGVDCNGDLSIDFSDTNSQSSVPVDNPDVIIGYDSSGYAIKAPKGVLMIGKYDPWILSDSATVPETGYIDKYIIDTLYTLYAVKTLENNYAVIMFSSTWIGGCEHQGFSWSYNPDGSRTFIKDIPGNAPIILREKNMKSPTVGRNSDHLLIYSGDKNISFEIFDIMGKKINFGTVNKNDLVRVPLKTIKEKLFVLSIIYPEYRKFIQIMNNVR